MCHAWGGTSLTFPIGLDDLELAWQMPHFSTASLISLEIPGQKHRVSCFEHTFFQCPGVLRVICSKHLASQCGGYHESGPFCNESVFHGEIFSVVPKSVKFSWQHSSDNWPSHMYVVSQKIECHVSSCLSMNHLNFTGTHRNAAGDKIHCDDQ